MLVAHGLPPAGKIDDGQAAHPKADVRTDPYSLIVRPAVDEGLDHPLQMAGIHLSDEAGDSAHVSLLPDLR